MTSYTDATETASTGEGKRNRKTHALSALLSATALGVFLEGCSGGDGASPAPNPDPTPAPVNDYERIGEDLYFPNANGINDFSFVRVVDSPDDVEITAGSDSGTIVGFVDNVYTLYYGSPAPGTKLGKLSVGTENGDTPLQGDDGANVMIGLGGNDELFGNAGDDILYGGEGDDELYGGEGADTLYGGAGNDELDGGAGIDTYLFYENDGTDTIEDNGGMVVFNQGNDDAYAGATYTFVRSDDGAGDRVTLTVTKGGDTLNIIEFTNYPSAGYTFYTRRGTTDTAIPDSLINVPARVIPGSESSPYRATFNVDTLTGSAGRDWVTYEGSSVGVVVDISTSPATVSGGWAAGDILTGINNLIGSTHADTLTGNSEDNTLRGRVGNDRLEGGAGNDRLYGEEGNDYLYGGADRDYLYGNAGNDELYGEDGNDTLYGGAGDDRLDGGAGGSDSAIYGSFSKGVRVSLAVSGVQVDFDGTHGFLANDNEAVGDVLINIEGISGSNSDDWLTGDGNNNTLQGRAGNDRLEGGAGNDRLSGGAGIDYLYGGAGIDSLDGGEGTDTYVFRVGDGTDSISDLAGDTMTLRFDGTYGAGDFTDTVFSRDGNDLVITLDKLPDDTITDKITIYNAYDTDTDPDTGTGNAAFTIHIEYGEGGTFTQVVDDVWSGLTLP